MPCRVGIAIPGPLYTRGLLANCGTCLLLGQFGNIHYTVYHHTHLVSNIQLFSRYVCLLDISCQYRVPVPTASGITASTRPMSHIIARKEQLMLLSTT